MPRKPLAGKASPLGRTSKQTEEILQKLEEALLVGATYRAAALYAGIAESTLHEWRAQESEFSECLTRAEGQAAVALLGIIERAAAEDWRAAAWKLERRYPSEYGRTVQTQELTGANGSATPAIIFQAIALRDSAQ